MSHIIVNSQFGLLYVTAYIQYLLITFIAYSNMRPLMRLNVP